MSFCPCFFLCERVRDSPPMSAALELLNRGFRNHVTQAKMMYFCSNVVLQLRPGWFPPHFPNGNTFLHQPGTGKAHFSHLYLSKPVENGSNIFPASPWCQLWLW